MRHASSPNRLRGRADEVERKRHQRPRAKLEGDEAHEAADKAQERADRLGSGVHVTGMGKDGTEKSKTTQKSRY